MKLRILHRTEYRYALPVRNNNNELRVTPIENVRQRTILHLVRVLPAVKMRRYQDLYRNMVYFFEVEEPHKSLEIDVSSVVETSAPPLEALPKDAPLSALARPEVTESLQPYLQSEGPVQVTPQIWRTALDVRADRKEVVPVVQSLMHYVHETCRYVPGVTTVSTTTEEFFAKPHGVCQDFTHLLLALCRALGIPARYVCGYVFDAKRGEVLGSHASHAWCEVWIPGHGWFGLDPTNKRPTNETYVASAVGRDYRDATPIRGSYWGTGDREMRVTVHVETK
jgi:transglutaminase-like putative cysteine protease